MLYYFLRMGDGMHPHTNGWVTTPLSISPVGVLAFTLSAKPPNTNGTLPESRQLNFKPFNILHSHTKCFKLLAARSLRQVLVKQPPDEHSHLRHVLRTSRSLEGHFCHSMANQRAASLRVKATGGTHFTSEAFLRPSCTFTVTSPNKYSSRQEMLPSLAPRKRQHASRNPGQITSEPTAGLMIPAHSASYSPLRTSTGHNIEYGHTLWVRCDGTRFQQKR